MASTSSSPFTRARVLSTLTTVQHASAIAFGSFLFIHLAAPAVAVVAPRFESMELATKTMILGRVYYQNVMTEPLVVWGALGFHALSSIAKRAILRLWKPIYATKEVEGYTIGDSTSSVPTRSSFQFASKMPSLHTLTGFLLLPGVMIHSWLTRIVPLRSENPIRELSPSELDYSYIVHGFTHPTSKAWRWITCALYTTLLLAGAFHVASGSDRITRRIRIRCRTHHQHKLSNEKTEVGMTETAPEVGDVRSNRANMRQVDARRKARRKKAATTGIALVAAGWLSMGIWRMVKDGSRANGLAPASWMAKRFDACYATVWPYSIVT